MSPASGGATPTELLERRSSIVWMDMARKLRRPAAAAKRVALRLSRAVRQMMQGGEIAALLFN